MVNSYRDRVFALCIAAVLVGSNGSDTLVLGGQGASEPRYWYDWTCRHRVLGSLCSVEGDRVLIQKRDGTVLRIPMPFLDPSDQRSIRACESAARAAQALRISPYINARTMLDKLRTELTAHGVSDAWAREIALFPDSTNQRLRGDRKLEQLRGRWVEIHGLQCEVVDFELLPDGIGFSRLVVKTPQNKRISVGPEWTRKVKILPAFWRYATYRPTASGDERFFRGPPSAETLTPDRQWVDRLAYDELSSAWTDAKSVEFHQLRAQARKQWEEASSLGRVAKSKWHVHRGDDWMVTWERSESRHDLHEAYKEYTAAIELVPSYADAYLRRAAVCMAAHFDASALQDLNEALTLAPEEKYIVMPGLEMRSRIHSRTPIDSGKTAAIAQRHGEEAVGRWQDYQTGLTDAKTKFAEEVVASDHWVPKRRLSESPTDVADQEGQPQEAATTEQEHKDAQDKHEKAVGQAWTTAKEQVTAVTQSFDGKKVRAKKDAEDSIDLVFQTHDWAISDADQLVALSAGSNLQETTEVLPPKYIGSPVHNMLLRLDAEDGPPRYDRLVLLVRDVAAKTAEREANKLKEDLSGLAFSDVASESANVSAFRASGQKGDINTVARLERGLSDLIAQEAVAVDVLTYIANKAVKYSPDNDRNKYRAIAQDHTTHARSYAAERPGLEKRLGEEERRLAYSLSENAFPFGAIFSADSSYRVSVTVPDIKRETSETGAVLDVLDTYYEIAEAKELIIDGDCAEAISAASSALEIAPDENLRKEAQDVLVEAVIHYVNSYPASVGFGY